MTPAPAGSGFIPDESIEVRVCAGDGLGVSALKGVSDGGAVGAGVLSWGIGEASGIADGFGVGVNFGVGVAEGVGVALGVAVAFGVDVGFGLGVAFSVGATEGDFEGSGVAASAVFFDALKGGTSLFELLLDSVNSSPTAMSEPGFTVTMSESSV